MKWGGELGGWGKRASEVVKNENEDATGRWQSLRERGSSVMCVRETGRGGGGERDGGKERGREKPTEMKIWTRPGCSGLQMAWQGAREAEGVIKVTETKGRDCMLTEKSCCGSVERKMARTACS